MNPTAYAQSILPMKHVIANTTKDEVFYKFHYLGNTACDSQGAISPGHVKQVGCESGGVFKPGIYLLDFEQVYFYGKRKVRCSASRRYSIGDKKLLIWKVSKRCQLDLIET
ncbi:MAG: hypothetical protein P1U32_09055 [Legionellaceae bacterium]|nr:hypothetical protein [Legionellaceae bacterium]